MRVSWWKKASKVLSEFFQDSCNVTNYSNAFIRSRPTIIHFFGSTSDEFYNGVSLNYIRGAYENLIEENHLQCQRHIIMSLFNAIQMENGVSQYLWGTMIFLMQQDYLSEVP